MDSGDFEWTMGPAADADFHPRRILHKMAWCMVYWDLLNYGLQVWCTWLFCLALPWFFLTCFAQNSCSCIERGDTSVSTPEFGMFCNPAWALGSYSSSLSAARAVRTKSMGRFYQADVKSSKENRSFCNSELCTGIPAGLGAWVQNTWHGTHQGNLPRPWPRSDSLVI